MASTSEVGHAKNIANFEDLISFSTGYGANYNPSKTALQLPQLSSLFTTAQTNLDNVTTTNTAYNTAVNARVQAFEGIKKLATKLVNALEATDASKQTVNDAKGFNKKIQGTSGKLTKADAGKMAAPIDTTMPVPVDPKVISNSQQSYDNIVEHFSKLINVLATEPSYNPNETPLQTATLNAQLTNLKNTNTAVSNAYTTVSNARIARDKSLYEPKTGLCDIAQDVKNYVKSVYGASAAEFKQISGLQFKTPKKK